MYNNTMTIKSWAEDDRPMEKMLNKGKFALSDAELLAIIIGSGTREETAVDLAQKILRENDFSLYSLGKLESQELMKYKGIGEKKAVKIMATIELGRRRSKAAIKLEKQINSTIEAYHHIKDKLQDLPYEEFWVMGLSQSNRILGMKLISKGGRSGTVADGKIIFKELLDMKACGAIFFHNHPSGKLDPSSSDIRLTKDYADFGKMINLKVIDHIIVGDTGFLSLKEKGYF